MAAPRPRPRRRRFVSQGPTNVTIKVDAYTLLKARVRPMQYGTSVNAVLNACLDQLAASPRPQYGEGARLSIPPHLRGDA
jgi:hypothetical protein